MVRKQDPPACASANRRPDPSPVIDRGDRYTSVETSDSTIDSFGIKAIDNSEFGFGGSVALSSLGVGSVVESSLGIQNSIVASEVDSQLIEEARQCIIRYKEKQEKRQGVENASNSKEKDIFPLLKQCKEEARQRIKVYQQRQSERNLPPLSFSEASSKVVEEPETNKGILPNNIKGRHPSRRQPDDQRDDDKPIVSALAPYHQQHPDSMKKRADETTKHKTMPMVPPTGSAIKDNHHQQQQQQSKVETMPTIPPASSAIKDNHRQQQQQQQSKSRDHQYTSTIRDHLQHTSNATRDHHHQQQSRDHQHSSTIRDHLQHTSNAISDHHHHEQTNVMKNPSPPTKKPEDPAETLLHSKKKKTTREKSPKRTRDPNKKRDPPQRITRPPKPSVRTVTAEMESDNGEESSDRPSLHPHGSVTGTEATNATETSYTANHLNEYDELSYSSPGPFSLPPQLPGFWTTLLEFLGSIASTDLCSGSHSIPNQNPSILKYEMPLLSIQDALLEAENNIDAWGKGDTDQESLKPRKIRKALNFSSKRLDKNNPLIALYDEQKLRQDVLKVEVNPEELPNNDILEEAEDYYDECFEASTIMREVPVPEAVVVQKKVDDVSVLEDNSIASFATQSIHAWSLSPQRKRRLRARARAVAMAKARGTADP